LPEAPINTHRSMDQPSPKTGVRMGNQRSALVASVCVAALAPLVVVALSGMAAIDFWWDFWMGLGFASVSGLALLPVPLPVPVPVPVHLPVPLRVLNSWVLKLRRWPK
jgi:hypothetical protein